MAVTVTHPFVSPIADAGNADEVGPNEWNAAHTIVGLGTAAEADATDFATAAQGALAATAVQPGSLATVATTGAYSDLSGKPTLGTAAATAATDYATAAQGGKADTALQSVVAGAGISVNVTDPLNPVISATGGGSGDMIAATYDPQAIAGDAFARANHTGTQAASTISDFSTAADARIAAAVGITVQAYDADLATWAGVTSSANGRSLVSAADYAAMRALLDLEPGTDFYSISAANAAFQPLDADLTAWAGVNPSSYSTTAAIAAAYQPLDADLTSWAGVTRAVGFDTFAATPSSANLRALLSDEEGTGAAYFVGGALGTPSSATLTNATGLPVSGITASTSTALGVGSVELGHATDTTLSRGAAGFIAIEGNRVPSPASQASGDLLYRGATEWERLAKGTAAQVLTMNAGATAPEWATASSGGMTLIGSATVTSGTTVSFTSLTPASYKRYLLEIEGLSHNDGSARALRVELSSTNGAAYGAAATVSASEVQATVLYGRIEIGNINSTTAGAKHLISSLNANNISLAAATNTGAAVNAIRLSWASGSFDATGPGLIRLYGVS